MTGRDVATLAASAVAAAVGCAVGVVLWGCGALVRRAARVPVPEPAIDLTVYEAHAWPTEDVTHRDNIVWHTPN